MKNYSNARLLKASTVDPSSGPKTQEQYITFADHGQEDKCTMYGDGIVGFPEYILYLSILASCKVKLIVCP